MKTKLLFLWTVLFSVCVIQAQETTVNTSLGAGYSNQVYYKLSTQTETVVTANSWDIAMLRTSPYAFGVRVNGGIGIQVFEASNNPADWATIDLANEASWTKLYNSDTAWNEGAFQQGSATYGWGEYNVTTHHIEGTVIFVLKYSDGSYKKLIIEDFFSGYTFKYSSWDGTSWSADETATVANTSNPNNKYNYYSLQNNQEVIVEPAVADWDFKFTRYYTDVQGQQYLVTGVLHSDEVEVSENDEPGGMPANPTLNYSTDINTIGYNWKTLNYQTFTYDVDSDKAFYVKDSDDTVFRMYFTSFAGSSTGNLSFSFEDVTSSLSIEEVSEGLSVGIYPNPSTDKRVNLVYDVNKLQSTENEIQIYSMTGQLVHQSNLKSTSGFYNKTLDLYNLETGVYIMKFISGSQSVSKKLILN